MWPALSVRAQALQRLTVASFTLSSDVGKPQVGVPFHLIVSLRVRERVAGIDNLELPILAELELLGDERTLQSGPAGTFYRETISVAARRAGDIVIAPATLQAIDTRDRRAKQYYTNGLTLRAVAAPGQTLASGARFVSSAVRFAFQLTIWVLGGLCAAALVVLFFRRRDVAVTASPQPLEDPVAPAPLASSPRDRLRDALTVLRAERTRDTALRVRAAVWAMVGAAEGETLTDVLQRPEAAGKPMRELLSALERAAFTYDGDLSRAIESACDALQWYLAT